MGIAKELGSHSGVYKHERVHFQYTPVSVCLYVHIYVDQSKTHRLQLLEYLGAQLEGLPICSELPLLK